MYSYTNILIKYLKDINPTNVMEWGPGKSTRIILDNIAEHSRLLSVEHDPKYYNKHLSDIKDHRWNIILKSITNRVSQYALICNTIKPIDLAFIDGRRRVECSIAAMLNLSDNGVCILHDASRKSYTDLLYPIIDVIEYKDDTLVFRKANHLVVNG